MKSRIRIYIFVVGVAVLAWILWPRPIQLAPAEQPAPVLAQTNRESAPPQRAPSDNISSNPSVGELLKHLDTNKARERQELMGRMMESANVPIDFYGQTVDQDGKPLPGVKIGITVRHWTASLEGTSLKADRTSDADGLFDIHGVTGDGFDIDYMSKPDYELEPMRRGFGSVGGTPSNPVIFKLWKNDTKQPLIRGQKGGVKLFL